MSQENNRIPKQTEDTSGPEQSSQPDANRLNILIVEDDDQSQRMLKLILGKTGHTLKFGFNGVDAVQSVKSEDFDLVLMDIQLPQMGGLEATRKIREWEKGKKHTAIVGLTAIPESEHRNCMQAGMDDVIAKPFDMEKLHEVFNACMEQKQVKIKRTTASAAVQTAHSSILDAQSAIKRFAGDQENYSKLLDEFVLSLSGKFEDLINDFQTGNWKDLSKHAHNLKGLSANFGAADLARKAFELDQCVNENRRDEAKQKLNEIDSSIHNLRVEALSFLKRAANTDKLI